MPSTNTSIASGHLYVISSPSGGGKTTLVSQLLECTPDVARAVTHTTRKPRPDEKNGVHYHFVSVETFHEMVAQDGFLEYASVFGNFYGTSRKEVDSRRKHGTDVLLVIDWQGAQLVRQATAEAISIFILPPSIGALHARLLSRNQDHPSVVEARMQDAVNQISHYPEFDYLVINDDFDMALASMRAIIMANRLRIKPQMHRHAELLDELLSSG